MPGALSAAAPILIVLAKVLFHFCERELRILLRNDRFRVADVFFPLHPFTHLNHRIAGKIGLALSSNRREVSRFPVGIAIGHDGDRSRSGRDSRPLLRRTLAEEPPAACSCPDERWGFDRFRATVPSLREERYDVFAPR